MHPHPHVYADLAAALRCLDDARESLARYGTIQVIDARSARIAFYTPYPIRKDAIQVRPGIHRLNWPDRRRRRRSSHTFQQWITALEASEIANTRTRFRAVALFDPTLTVETDHPRTLYRWMRFQWQHHKISEFRRDERE